MMKTTEWKYRTALLAAAVVTLAGRCRYVPRAA